MKHHFMYNVQFTKYNLYLVFLIFYFSFKNKIPNVHNECSGFYFLCTFNVSPFQIPCKVGASPIFRLF